MVDIYSEEENGDLINDAVYFRNTILEDKYNFRIEFNGIPTGSTPVDIIKPLVLAADQSYDIIYDGLSKLRTMALENMLIDLYVIPNIDFDKPWWDETANSELSLAHKLYFTYGEHMLGPKSGLYCIIFSKTLAENLGLGDLYQYIRDDEWNWDTFSSLAKDRYQDLNADGKYDKDDIYGFVTENYNAYTAIISGGVKIAEKDENDLPYLTMNTERGIQAVDKMMGFLGDINTTFYVNKVTGVNDYWKDFWRDSFNADKILFREGAMHDIPGLRAMESDFGILPMPKMFEGQESYYHTLSVMNAQMMAIPVTCVDIDTVSYIIEMLACESMYTLTPAYYEVQLKTKAARDNKSSEMLDVIFATKTFDIGAIFGWGNLSTIYSTMASTYSNTFASSYAAAEPAALTEMQQTIEQLLEK